MTVDVRAKVFCNIGTIISGNIADEALSVGQGLISCRGQLVLAGLSTPAVGSAVNIGWERDGTIARLPRTLRVLSSFANPLTRQTTVQLGDRLVYLANLRGKKAAEETPAQDQSNGPKPNTYPSSEYDWQAGQKCYLPKAGAKPYNFGSSKAANTLTVREEYALAPAKVMNRTKMGIRASSVLQKCCAALGITSSGAALTNIYQDEFDLSTGYVSVIDQLISSESLFGYLNESEVLVLRGWDGAGSGPLLTTSNIIELNGINAGMLPGQTVSVSFDAKRLQQTAAQKAQQELQAEDDAKATKDDPASTQEQKDQAQAQLDQINQTKQQRDWERDEAITYNQEYTFYVKNNQGQTTYTFSVAHNPRTVTETYYDESDYKIKGITREERILAGEVGSILQARLNVLAQQVTATSTPVALTNLYVIARTALIFRTEEYLEYVTIKQEPEKETLPLDPDLLCPPANGEQRVADEDAAKNKRVEKQQIRQTIKRFEPVESLIGKLNISGMDWGRFDLATLPGGEYEAERTVITYETNQPEGQTKTRTDRYLAYGLTQNGQQDTAEKGAVTTTLQGINDLVVTASRLVFEGTSVAIQQDRTFGIQQRPAEESRQEAEQEKQPAVGATDEDGRQQTELEQTNTTVETTPKTELEMPLASDDAVVWSASNGYEFKGSNAMVQAMRYARTQNAVMYGNRAGVSLQLPAYAMPLYPLSSVYLQLSGLTAAYKANGMSWSFNSDGILGAMDALYAGAVGGSGTFWMPVAPGITSLPSNPTVTTGSGTPANATTTPSGFDPTAPGSVFNSLPVGQAPSFAQSVAPAALVPYVNERVPAFGGTRTAVSVLVRDYPLTLPSSTVALVSKAEITAATHMAAAASSFSSAGQAAELRYRRTLVGAAGSFGVTGFGAGSVRDYRIGTNFGTFNLGAGSVDLVQQRSPLAADAGAVLLSGQDAGFAKAIVISSSTGSFVLSGQAAGSRRDYVCAAAAGSLAITGQVTNLNYISPQVALLTYTGNGLSTNAVTGAGFTPGLVWAKRIGAAENHWLFFSLFTPVAPGDSHYVLNTNGSGASSAGTTMLTFDSSGFTLKDSWANTNGAGYWAMCLKAGGAAATNTNGSITTTVSVNSGLGFSQFKYDPTGSAGTIGHGLGVTPELVVIVVAGYSSGIAVGGSAIGANYYLTHNSTAARTSSTSVYTGFSSSTISVGNDAIVNRSAASWAIGYAFASVGGVSKIGTFSGNGSSTQAISGVGFQPRFVMVKSYDGGTSNWVMFTSGRDGRLLANTNAAESATDYITFNSDGFTLESGAGVNSSGVSYFYLAFS